MRTPGEEGVVCVCNSIPDPEQLTDRIWDKKSTTISEILSPLQSKPMLQQESQCLVGCSCKLQLLLQLLGVTGLKSADEAGLLSSLTFRHPRTIKSRRVRVCVASIIKIVFRSRFSCQD